MTKPGEHRRESVQQPSCCNHLVHVKSNVLGQRRTLFKYTAISATPLNLLHNVHALGDGAKNLCAAHFIKYAEKRQH